MTHGKSLAFCGLLLLTTSSMYGCGGGGGGGSEAGDKQPLPADGLSNITQDDLSIVGATNNINLYPAALSQLALSAINSLGKRDSFSVACGPELSDTATINIQRQTPGEFSSNDIINISLVNCYTTLMDSTALTGNISIDVSHISYGPVLTELNAILSYPSLLNQLDNGEGLIGVAMSGEHSLAYTFANEIQQIDSFQSSSQYTNLGDFFLLTDAEVTQTHDLINNTTAMDMQGKVKWSGNGTTLSYEVSTPETLEGILGWGFNSGKLIIQGAGEQMVEFSANVEAILPSGSISIFDTYIKGLDVDETFVLGDGDVFGGDAINQPVLHSNIFSHIPEGWYWSEDNTGIHTGMLYSDGTLESYQKTAQGGFALPHYIDFPSDGSFTVYAKDISLNGAPAEVHFAIFDEYAGGLSVDVTRVGYRYTITPSTPPVPGRKYNLTSNIDGEYNIATFTVAGSYDPADLSIAMPDDRFVRSGEAFVLSPTITGFHNGLYWEGGYSGENWWTNDIQISDQNSIDAEVTVTGAQGKLASISTSLMPLEGDTKHGHVTVQIAESDKDKSFLQITEYDNVQAPTNKRLFVGYIREFEDNHTNIEQRFTIEGASHTKTLSLAMSGGTVIDSENTTYSFVSMEYSEMDTVWTNHEYNFLNDCTVDRVELKQSIGSVSGTRSDFTIHCNQETGYIKGFIHNFYE
ncbi:hypothetical protein M0C34_00365 [Agarivorans sp. TSD2052]|uniref:hypothetical protein n=1 Tax=Agarivorans sp. TSD2052 TaxID=2937286 RepID=UPI00200FF7F2|nr:hypothetical protein [Agarivorans sp. TSD2052]UPW18762.1 hypothetical protein M0C34_00365 [Agarivorans sp. TSD2052]